MSGRERVVIVGAVVCPGAPFLVPGVADRLAAQSVELVTACEAALRSLAGAERIVLVTAGRGPHTRLFPAGVQVSPAPLRRSDLPPRSGPSPTFGVGSIVGRALMDRVSTDVPAPVDIVETGDDPSAAAAAVDHQRRPGPVGLLVVADGAARHGDHAPGRRDDRSTPFDEAVATALADGDPEGLRLACADREVARELLAVTDPLLALAALTAADRPAAAELLYRGSPYGVGYLVASWRWNPR